MSDLPSEFRRTQIIPALALALACIGAASMVYYHLGLFMPRVLQIRDSMGLGNGYSFGGDFYPVWLTAQKSRLGHVDLYSDAVTRETQIGVFGHPLEPGNKLNLPRDYRQYSYPAFTNLILWPCGLLDFPRFRVVLALLLPTLTAVSIWMWLKALRWNVHPMWIAVLITLTLGTYELLEAFFALQPGLFVGFFLAAAALCLRSKRFMLAGALCSLTLIKPQVTLLAILYMLLWSFSDRSRARFWQGFLVVTAVLMTGSLWIWPHWFSQWVGVLREYHGYARPPLVGMLVGGTIPPYIVTIIICIILFLSGIVMWRGRRLHQDVPGFWLALSLLLAITSVTLLPGQAMYDHFILLPGIFLILRNRKEFRSQGPIQRTLLLIGAVILFWPWFSSFALLVLRPLFTPAVFYSIPVFSLPIRNVASFPFAVIALLAWTWKRDSAMART